MDVPISFQRTIINTYFGNNMVVVARFALPANYSVPNAYIDATVAEWQGPPTYRQTTISAHPCDFRPLDPTGLNGPLGSSGGTTPQIYVGIGASAANPKIVPGVTYYLNIRNTWIDENGQARGSCQENTNCNASIVIIDRHN